MELICKNQDLISHFSGKNSLLDGNIKKIEISEESESVFIVMRFHMRKSSDYKKIDLMFSKCLMYSFFYSSQYYFYTIEQLKFFQDGDGLFYTSFDPVDETEKISDLDQDCILCQKISAYFVD